MALGEDSDELRKLARAVMAGELARDEYRRARTALIDRYAGEQPVAPSLPAATPPESPTLPELRALAEPVAPAAPARLVDPPQDAPAPRHDVVIGIVAVVAVLAALGAALAWFW